MSEPYDDLYRALGRVAYEWSWLEDDVSRLVFDLSAIQSPAFYDDEGVGRVAVIMNANSDSRSNFAVAKALADKVPNHPGFYERVENTMNLVGMGLRNDRNRCIHDLWAVTGGRAIRFKPGTKVTREKGTGKRRVDLHQTETFDSIADVEALALRINDARQEIISLCSEAQAIFRSLYPAEE